MKWKTELEHLYLRSSCTLHSCLIAGFSICARTRLPFHSLPVMFVWYISYCFSLDSSLQFALLQLLFTSRCVMLCYLLPHTNRIESTQTSCNRGTQRIVRYKLYQITVIQQTCYVILCYMSILVRDAIVITHRRAIAMMFVHLSVCLGRACIVIIYYACTLAPI